CTSSASFDLAATEKCRYLGLQILREELERPRPRELRRRLVVARRGVIVEAVLRAGIHVHLVLDARGLERRLVCGPALVDPLIGAGIVQQQRRLDLRRVVRRGLRTIEGNRRSEVGEAHGDAVDDAATEAEADGAELAAALGPRL